MNFPESLEYLYNLGNEVMAMKLGLTATEKLLDTLDNFEKHFWKFRSPERTTRVRPALFLIRFARAQVIEQTIREKLLYDER